MPAERRCRGCGETKPLTEFIQRVREDGRIEWTRCKPCLNARSRARYQVNPESFRRARRKSEFKKKFGITVEQYETMLEAQGGGCALCGGADEYRALAVDHDHRTGVVRGLLCTQCNLGVGVVEKMGLAWLGRVLTYLRSPVQSVDELLSIQRM